MDPRQALATNLNRREQYLKLVDWALYSAKQNGRNLVELAWEHNSPQSTLSELL